MELKDTVEMMNSSDYKERFKAEYQQVVIRYKKLKAMLDKWDNGELNFNPTCPRSTYNMQVRAMTDYISVLEARAVMENVELKKVKNITLATIVTTIPFIGFFQRQFAAFVHGHEDDSEQQLEDCSILLYSIL